MEKRQTPSNPIVPGFAPDPSITVIDGEFYLVVSSFHLFPGLPLFHSKDLVSWEQIGNVINRPSQLSLAKSSTRLIDLDEQGKEILLATGGLYAPTIRHHKGTTFVICTNVDPGEDASHGFSFKNFYVSTQNIDEGEWSHPIYFDFHGIDPDLFWDNDGRTYVVGSAWGDRTTISCQEIDLQTGANIQQPRTIWEGFSKVIPEGPHIYRKDGFYYLLIAEGGTSEDHCVVIARALNIFGPYESCPQNPILPKASEKNTVQHTGHGDLFQDKAGAWWMTCLGVRKDDKGRYHMGRESFLTQVNWEPAGWPVIEPIQVSQGLETIRTMQARTHTDFVHIRESVHDAIRIDTESATGQTVLHIQPSVRGLESPEGPISFVGKRQRAIEGASSVKLEQPVAAGQVYVEAGIALYKDEYRFLRLFVDSSAPGQIQLSLRNNVKAICIVRSAITTIQGPQEVTLLLHYTNDTIKASYRVDTGAEVVVGVVDTLNLTGYDFVGPVIGAFATLRLKDGLQSCDMSPVVFKDFKVE